MDWKGKIIVLCVVLGACSQATHESKIVSKPIAVQLMLKDDCFSCHATYEQNIAPPYMDISKRYAEYSEVVKPKLIQKVINGGGGLWYGGNMSPHPFLKPEEVSGMVEWVLSLDERDSTDLKKSESLKNTSAEGVFAVEIVQADLSFIHGYVDQIHLETDQFLEWQSAGKTLRFSANVELKIPGRYMFHLHKTGQGSLTIDGQVVISNRAKDMEAIRTLTAGLHKIEVTYIPLGKSDALKLSWLTPTMSHYHVMKF
ncbi:PA14 domain-containing protein [Reichenbachiella carrageenanivorans]|uniref:PA14 domain-containing protein n=1 Tax=Reichenbachiella carrageenanivorans TaxID=2979869 RepID=A0ABY6CVC3_9BACT|nr:c-type cytochrome [Reichenbachiella carrageenanivorans]UXX77862.1 PA14 domain-containing protein [Reichenbachiella carrageenanivorans]